MFYICRNKFRLFMYKESYHLEMIEHGCKYNHAANSIIEGTIFIEFKMQLETLSSN